jgi:hypothetical protein
MKILFWLFGKKSTAKKSVEKWKADILARSDWELENMVKNPGEFVVEMRHAAAEILEQRKRT